MRRPLLIALGVMSLQLPAWRTGLYVADEGWTVHVASRIADGEVLYRDVHTYLPPGIYWVLALPMKLRRSLLWGRLLMLLACGALGLAAALLGRGRGRNADLAAAAAMALLAAVGYPSYTIPSYTGLSVACGLLAFALWDGGMAPIGCGVLVGMALLFKQTTGVLALAAIVIAQVLERRVPWKRLLGGLAAVGSSSVAILLLQGSLRPMASALSPATMALYGSLGRVPFPSFADLQSGRLATTLPFLVDMLPEVLRASSLRTAAAILTWLLYVAPLPIALVYAATAPAERRARDRALGILAALVYLALFPRADVTHLLQVLPPAAILVGLLAARIPRVAMAASILGIVIALSLNGGRRAYAREPLAVPHDGGIRVPRAQAGVRDIILALRRHPGEPFLAAPWGALYYFLADRRNPTRFPLLLPGNIGPDQKREVLALMATDPPREILWSTVDLSNLTPVTFEEFFPELVRVRDGRYRRAAGPIAGEEIWERRP